MKKYGKIALLLDIKPSNYPAGVFPPLSLLYLATLPKQQGFLVDIFDRRLYGSDHSFHSAIISAKPDIIGSSLFANNYTDVYKTTLSLKRVLPSAVFILGGPEASVDSLNVFKTFYPHQDFLLAGEADHSFMQLVDSLAQNDKEALYNIPGLHFFDSEFITNSAQPPIENLDDIPIPSREVIPNAQWKQYRRLGLGAPADMLITSRGCPYSCKFCFQMTPIYRSRSAENVLEEIDQIYRRGTRAINIADDNFSANRKRCLAILEGVLSRGYSIKFKGRGRVNNMDPELLALMKRAGFQSIALGIESGSQAVLDAMSKKTTVEQNARAIAMVKEAGMQCYADLFLGYPGETLDTIRETSDFLLRTKPTAVNMGILYPLHGTSVFDEAQKNGTLVGDWGLLQEPPWVRLPWMSDFNDLVIEWRKVSRTFWLNPSILTQVTLSNIRHFTFSDYIHAGKLFYLMTRK